MLNSLTSYLWGSNVNSEEECPNKIAQEQSYGEHLETQQEGDWILVGTADEIITNDQQEDTENRDFQEQPLVNEQSLHDEGQGRAETNVLQQRNTLNHAAVHPGQVSAQQLVKSIHLAQRVQYSKAQKHISKIKCERQNKVQECESHGKGSSRRNKRMHPSGVRSSRFTQRF